MSAVISVRGVSVRRETRDILLDIDLDVRLGEVLALVGPNGAGKSTLLSVLSGDLSPASGSVELDDRPISSYRALELARRRAVLTQANVVSFPFRVIEIVQMGRSPWMRTAELADDQQAVLEAIQATDIEHLLGRRFTTLSGGEQARVSLARVLAQRTPVVFLDEPTAALDLRHQEDVMRLSRELAGQGRAVVVVVHDLSLAGAYADRIALLDAGRLDCVGTPAEVMTADRVGRVYGLDVQIHRLGASDRPVVLPLRD
ncbi:MAG: heme ABC transporter ATP-binding protein [Microcella sp.]|uniref:heme ABC transporter ATP-binding protein n=1 Tax=Microcella sp. TaxID=1913979 RepID=UPI0024C96585|nr:heme ABC transporter ATP-binding protein [Microcella sp.]UYN83200.1 MAG: heme ABC transporter ATP-binding protein [Microcella sp.]